jgi:hypothetical protein
MPTEYTVVGEHREDESQLLVVGADERYYSYTPARDSIMPTDLDEDTWVVHDPVVPQPSDSDATELEVT